jgi:hypothetical protein
MHSRLTQKFFKVSTTPASMTESGGCRFLSEGCQVAARFPKKPEIRKTQALLRSSWERAIPIFSKSGLLLF